MALDFSWLSNFIANFLAFLRSWQIGPTNMLGFLVGLALVIVVIRALLLKG